MYDFPHQNVQHAKPYIWIFLDRQGFSPLKNTIWPLKCTNVQFLHWNVKNVQNPLPMLWQGLTPVSGLLPSGNNSISCCRKKPAEANFNCKHSEENSRNIFDSYKLQTSVIKLLLIAQSQSKKIFRIIYWNL